MDTTSMIIAINEAEQAAGRVDGDITDRLRAAMAETKDHWLITEDGERFKAAVGGVMSFYGEDSPEYERLRQEMIDIGRVSALFDAARAGLSVSLSSLVDVSQELREHERVGLADLWREVKRGIGRKYRRLPLEVTAVQLTTQKIFNTPNGDMIGRPGDWVITSGTGAKWICEKVAFSQLYEAI